MKSFVLLIALTLLCGCSYLPWSKKEQSAPEVAAQAPKIALKVDGVEGGAADNIKAYLTLAQRPCDTPEAYLGALRQRGLEEAHEALQALGYYQAEVTIELAEADNCPLALVAVAAGPRAVFDTVDIQLRGPGASDPGFVDAVAQAGLSSGQPLDHGAYEAAKTLIASVALERGYLSGHYTLAELRVRPDDAAADVHLHFETGERLKLGEVTISTENQFLDEALVRRYLDIKPDSPYHAEVISDWYSTLAGSDYFSMIEVKPRIAAPTAEAIPVDIALSPKKRHRYQAGAGVSTDEGVRTRFNYQDRRVNHAGHRLSAELRASIIEQRLGTEYRIPRVHPSNEWVAIQAGVRREDIDTFDTTEVQLGISETKRRPWGWMETRFVNLNHQSFDIASDSDAATLIIPGLRWRKTTADDPLYPRKGYSLEAEIRGAAEVLASDTSFVRAMLSWNTVYGFAESWRVLVRGDAGYSWVDAFTELPPSERFFAGGDASIRGYDFEDLGPEDNNGDVIGGRYLAVASLELEKMFTDSWGAAAFVDAGNAFGGTGSATGLKMGIGLGLRWRSPLGPARVDLAHPLDADNVIRLHLRIGPDL